MTTEEAFAPTQLAPRELADEPAPPPSSPTSPAAPGAADPGARSARRRRAPRKAGRLEAAVRRLAGNLLFWLLVVLPTVASGIYYGAVASDLYVSESKFIVRMPQRQTTPSLMGSLLQGSGFMRSQDDTYSVHAFMQSRDALRTLDEALGLRAAYSAPTIDRLSRFPAPWDDDSFESLFRYHGSRMGVAFDAATSITTLRVAAFTPEQAHAINARLLEMGEAMVNQINARGRGDLVRFAEEEVAQAEQRAKDAAAAVAAFRSERAVFDPERQSSLQLQSVLKLQEELIAAKAQLAQVQVIAPQNPQIPNLLMRVQQIEQAMRVETARVLGGNGSLTGKVGDFERLALERAFADRQLASALSALETARNEARRQQLYLERVVQPNQPDDAEEPRRLRNVLATLVVGLILWGVATLMLASVREHQR